MAQLQKGALQQSFFRIKPFGREKKWKGSDRGKACRTAILKSGRLSSLEFAVL
jgi:hypothetical protein